MYKLSVDYFDLSQILRSGQCFRMYEREPGHYEIIAKDRRLFADRTDGGYEFSCNESEFEGFWRNYFDLDTDYGRFVSSVDPEDEYLMNAVESASGVRILRQDLWEMIVTFLISQQNNIPRIRRCVENICTKYGRDMGGFHAFPEPEALAGLPEDALMECNLGYRSKYVVRTAAAVASGSFELKPLCSLSYEEARKRLLTLYGVGGKVADCIALFALHRIEAFPVDTHIRQVLEKHYADGFPFGRYDGFAGIIQQYIFYYELL